MYGFGCIEIEFKYINDWGDICFKKYFFEGILYNLECCYCDIEFNLVCEELVKYIFNKFCSSCDGMCLKIEVCNVFINDIVLLMIVELSIVDVLMFF